MCVKWEFISVDLITNDSTAQLRVLERLVVLVIKFSSIPHQACRQSGRYGRVAAVCLAIWYGVTSGMRFYHITRVTSNRACLVARNEVLRVITHLYIEATEHIQATLCNHAEK